VRLVLVVLLLPLHRDARVLRERRNAEQQSGNRSSEGGGFHAPSDGTTRFSFKG
jgi:hypothetical protein